MVNLIVHLVKEIRICDPIFIFFTLDVPSSFSEGCMKIFKGYLKNLYRSEASIVERYIYMIRGLYIVKYLCYVKKILINTNANEKFLVYNLS